MKDATQAPSPTMNHLPMLNGSKRPRRVSSIPRETGAITEMDIRLVAPGPDVIEAHRAGAARRTIARGLHISRCSRGNPGSSLRVNSWSYRSGGRDGRPRLSRPPLADLRVPEIEF